MRTIGAARVVLILIAALPSDGMKFLTKRHTAIIMELT